MISTPSHIPSGGRRPRARLLIATAALAALVACDEPLDFDLRGPEGGFNTRAAARNATVDRPAADARGVISYPNYQVAVARRGDTLNDVAARVGLPADELARYNGIAVDVPLRKDEVIALPRRVSEPTTGIIGAPTGVDVTTLAGSAIDRAEPTPASPSVSTAPLPPTGQEPVRHKVERGETAFTIARLYQVPVKSLAEWNGLDASFSVREGQFLLIPVARVAAPARDTAAPTTLPGAGSTTPTPPSATKPLPQDDTTNDTATAPKPTAPVADVGETTATPAAVMRLPVQGSIIRPYAKGRNEGIDIKAAPGAPVNAAAAGTVAAITKSADGIPIIVVRHPNNLLTVYANVDGVKVAKGDSVRQGQAIAQLRSNDDQAFVHFEVRDGFDSVDPGNYLP
ncbi:peptidoglycan DD-metalloendopeptidase family protein [uncultured Tateyamaria sp.]|uniref:peptidoglycan DD-metalloendopeptidase family protein n=1 Tax=uncultured Tateyamaria sp. TaxID=455651 RepID=UPI002629135B|nr:peptidoglycan DD-metalloendopeptidase family protein [uncultured Tateyamaria sp.]